MVNSTCSCKPGSNQHKSSAWIILRILWQPYPESFILISSTFRSKKAANTRLMLKGVKVLLNFEKLRHRYERKREGIRRRRRRQKWHGKAVQRALLTMLHRRNWKSTAIELLQWYYGIANSFKFHNRSSLNQKVSITQGRNFLLTELVPNWFSHVDIVVLWW